MQGFPLTVDKHQFEIVLPPNFNEIIEGVAEAFDAAEQEAEDGVIPANRQAVMIDARLRIRSPIPEAEMVIEDALQATLSHMVGKAIGRKCRVSGVFVGGERPVGGWYESHFDVTFVALK